MEITPSSPLSHSDHDDTRLISFSYTLDSDGNKVGDVAIKLRGEGHTLIKRDTVDTNDIWYATAYELITYGSTERVVYDKEYENVANI
nr:hypothetical protein [Tanacetum cinerariifolium]